MNHRQLILSAALALALASPAASAMGLGQLQVKSGLNQPLVAEIPIISATASELEQLDVRLASPEAFSRVGLDQPSELTANLQFSVGQNTRGLPVIRVTTPTRFTEPLLSFLIEAQWGKGVVTREYSALIDPPYIAPAIVKPMLTPAIATVMPPPAVSIPAAPAPAVRPAEAAATRAVAESAPAPAEPLPAAPMAAEPLSQPAYSPPPSAPASEPQPAYVPPPPAPEPFAAAPLPEPEPVPAPIAAEPPPEPAAAPVAPEPKPATAEHVGPIKSGQTLSGIAGNLGSDAGVSVNQMMIALLRANPDAFDADNVNRLRSGSVLRVPGQDEVKQQSAAEAGMLVRQQANSWRTPRQAVPQPVEAPATTEPPTAHDIALTPPAPKPEPPLKPELKPEPPTAPKPEARPAPIAQATLAPPAVQPRLASKPARTTSRLEIVPPAGDARARGTQSGAASGAGGTELRAELVQAREDLAAKSSEVGDLKSRLSDLEKQQVDRQRMIDLQNSKLKQLQDRLQQMEAEKAAAAAAAAAPAPGAAQAPGRAPAQAAPAMPAAAHWYMNPFVLGGALLVLLGAIVLGLRRGKPGFESDARGTKLSDDEALRASMAKTREASERIRLEPAVAPAKPAPLPADVELQACLDAVSQRPQDLEARLNLLRLYHARGDALHYEQAAQSMRGQVPSTLDPRWREAVIMGAVLLPGHALFGQAGWNSPRFDADPGKPMVEPADESAPASPTAQALPAAATPGAVARATDAAAVRVFDPPADYESALNQEHPLIRDEPDLSELNLDDHATVFGDAFGTPPTDIHRSEAEVLAEDQSSATRIELAKAYLDIGDVDGARSMLEEVLIEGGPSAKAEAGRILRELP